MSIFKSSVLAKCVEHLFRLRPPPSLGRLELSKLTQPSVLPGTRYALLAYATYQVCYWFGLRTNNENLNPNQTSAVPPLRLFAWSWARTRQISCVVFVQCALSTSTVNDLRSVCNVNFNAEWKERYSTSLDPPGWKRDVVCPGIALVEMRGSCMKWVHGYLSSPRVLGGRNYMSMYRSLH